MRDGAWFVRGCRLSVRIWPVDAARTRTRRSRLRDRMREMQERVRSEEARLDVEAVPDGGPRAPWRSLRAMRRQQDRAARAFAQPAFHRALESTQLPVTLDEVLRFATVAAIGTSVLALTALSVAAAAGTGRDELLGAAWVARSNAKYGSLVEEGFRGADLVDEWRAWLSRTV